MDADSTKSQSQNLTIGNESEADFYRLLAENTSDGLAVFNNIGKLIYASPSYLNMMKSTFEIESNKSKEDLQSQIHPDDLSTALELIMTAINHQKDNIIYQYRILIENEYRWREDHNKFVYDDEGNVVRSYIVARDITDLKNAELQSLKHYNLLESMANSAPVMIWIDNENKECIYFNDYWLEYRGKTLEEERYNGWIEGMHPDDRENSDRIYNIAFEKREAYSTEFRLLHKSGEYRWVLDSGRPRYDLEGNFIGYVGSCVDIDEQKKLQEELCISNKFIVNLTEQVTGVIYQYKINSDGSQEWSYISPRVVDLYEVTVESVYANAELITSMVPPDDLNELLTKITESKEKLSVFLIEHRIITPTGKLKWIRSESRPERLADGSTVWYGFSKDITARILAQQQFESTRIMLEQTLENTPNVAVQWYDINGRVLYWNNASEILFGYTALEAVGKTLDNLLHTPEENQAFLNTLQQVNITEEPVGPYKAQIRRKDGTVGQVLATTFKLNINTDEPVYVCMDIDISEMELKAQELRATKEILESTSRLALVGGWEVDLINNKANWTDVTKDIHEVPRESQPDLSQAINFYKEGYSRDKVVESVKKAIELGESFDFELELIAANGKTKWVRAIGEAEFVDGECVRIFGAFQDIDAQKRLQAELERLSYVITHINDVVVITGSDGLIEWVNQAFTTNTGYSLDEVKGLKPGSFLQGVDTDKDVVKRISQAVNSQNSIRETILNYSKDGKPYWVDLNISPIFGINGKLDYFVSIQRNVTERIKYEQEILNINNNLEKKVVERTLELEKSNKALIEINKMKDKFIGIASHDLKNPLTSIIGQTEILAAKLDRYGEEIKPIMISNINNILSTANRMNEIINEFLDINKIQEGKYGVNKQHYKVVDVCHQVVDNMLGMATKKNIELIKEVDESKVIYIDRLSMMQIAENLISNAIKYSYPNSKVLISCIAQQDSFTLTVEDFGQGMDADDLTKLYKPYTKMSSKPTAGENSVGLGLSIVKHLVEINNGTIKCESQKGVGTKFVLSFPQFD